MQTTDANTTSQIKKAFIKDNMPIIVGGIVLCVSSALLGYTIGHRQGLTVVGFDADAEQLVGVVRQQKAALDQLNKNLNLAVQERDVAVESSNDLFKTLEQTKSEKLQISGMSGIYREVLRQRGGVSLMVQNLAIKVLPENAFEYHLDLMQVSPSRRRASGSAELRLISGTEVLVVPMEINSFSFEDFERLTGRWTMPKGFTPQYIEVRLNGSTPVIKRFSWQKGSEIESLANFAAEIPQVEAHAQ